MSTSLPSALDSARRAPLVSALVGATLLAGWAAWFAFGRLSVYEVSRAARLEVDVAPHEVGAPVGGRVLRSRLALGATVAAGDVLVELDAEAYALELAKERAHLAALDPQIAALKKEVAEDERAARGEAVVAEAAHDEAEALRRASDSLAALKTTEQAQLDALREQRAVAELESRRMRSEAEQRVAEAEAARTGVRRLGGEVMVRRGDRRARLARLELEVAQFVGVREQTAARMRVLEREIAVRTVRAPVAGTLGDVLALRSGAVVDAGTRLAVVVPSGGVRAVAFFEPAVIGRVRPGQPGRVRLLGFSWTKYGALGARVLNVGSEPSGGLVRVELELVRDRATRAPFEHGLPGVVEVRVEETSPASLVLDTAGRFITGLDARPAAADTTPLTGR